MKTYTLVLKDGERELASWQVDKAGSVINQITAYEKKCANPECPWNREDYRLQDMIIHESKYYCCEDCLNQAIYQ